MSSTQKKSRSKGASKSHSSGKIEFLEDKHLYLYGGVIIPSVSQLLRHKFSKAYSGVPSEVLKRKAAYGTKTHQTIESFIRGDLTMQDIQNSRMDPNIKVAVEQFEMLRKEWGFHAKDMEQIVTYEGRYAGTYDILTIDNYIIDLKTTAELHKDWLSYQLGLYYLAAGIDQKIGYCIWLPKGKAGSVVQIDVATKEECIRLLEDYESETTEE